MSLASFQRELQVFTEKTAPDEVAKLTKKISFEALRRVVFKTPVDTGHARNNWQVSVNSDFDSTIEGVDRAGGVALNRGTKKINGIPPFATVWIGNNVIYIRPLEGGHSKQAPNGMVEPTVSELEAVFR